MAMYGCIALLATCATPASALSGATNKRTLGHGLLQHQLQATRREDGLVAPQANDTITEDYWNMIDSRIAEHDSQTEAPVGANEQGTTESSSWGVNKWLGFEQPGTSTPAPSQDDTSAQFVAQCPMIMFNTEIYIEAPKCDSSWGSWKDPADNYRPILRWKTREDGGLVFGVDSVVNGEGAAEYAKLKQDLSFSAPSFQLANCMGVPRYSVDEEVVKVQHVSQGVSSTVTNHDTQASGEAFFYRYTIKQPNGSSVAQSDLFRLAQNSVNVTLTTKDDGLAGKMVVSAVRVGKWKGNEWTKCDGEQRGWQVSMMIESRDMYMATTVMDLRVAATAVLTLMAHRDESVDENTGTTSDGQGNLFSQLLISLMLLLIGFIIFLAILWFCQKKGIDAKCRRVCFKIEGACLPRRPGVPLWRQSPFQKLSAASAPKA